MTQENTFLAFLLFFPNFFNWEGDQLKHSSQGNIKTEGHNSTDVTTSMGIQRHEGYETTLLLLTSFTILLFSLFYDIKDLT